MCIVTQGISLKLYNLKSFNFFEIIFYYWHRYSFVVSLLWLLSLTFSGTLFPEIDASKFCFLFLIIKLITEYHIPIIWIHFHFWISHNHTINTYFFNGYCIFRLFCWSPLFTLNVKQFYNFRYSEKIYVWDGWSSVLFSSLPGSWLQGCLVWQQECLSL